MYKTPVVTEVRDVKGLEFEADDGATDWYKTEAKKYASALKSSGRSTWFENAYKPIETTACEVVNEAATKGTVCGFVYFPCSDENGCRAVLQGTW